MPKHYFAIFILAFVPLISTALTPPETRTANFFDSIRNDPQELKHFISRMPKGGDLHMHQSGATYAENMLRYAYNDHLCLNPATFIASVDPNCPADNLLDNEITHSTMKDKIIDAWSMRHFDSHQTQLGHDHFFATFSKFSVIPSAHTGEVLSEIVQRAALEDEIYLEIMSTLDSNESGKLGQTLGWNADFAIMRKKLLSANFAKILNDITTNLNTTETKMRSLLACDSSQPKPGCDIKIRYLYQVLREQPPEMVFAQLLAGFEIAQKDSRVVGLNMVQPEDGIISMRDYKLHMQMIGYLHQLYPTVHVSLHAGELSNAIATPEGLSFHIQEAISTAHADRIGHGVDIQQENAAELTLTTMAAEHNLVEINLSSNAAILGIEGDAHPLPIYLRYHVPVTLSTDDEGVSRSNLTHEYLRAFETYHFDYMILKVFARNSIAYAFLPGKTLWSDYDYQEVALPCAADILGTEVPSTSCKKFLDHNEKAAMQWKLEQRFNSFEASYK